MSWAEEHAKQRANMDETHLPKLRSLLARFPEIEEKDKFGGAWFYAGKKVLCNYHGDPVRLSFAATKEDQDALCQAGICEPTPYMHQHGWVTLKELDWEMVDELLESAFQKVALVRMKKAYDASQA